MLPHQHHFLALQPCQDSLSLSLEMPVQPSTIKVLYHVPNTTGNYKQRRLSRAVPSQHPHLGCVNDFAPAALPPAAVPDRSLH
jgi:hypothetical protein